MADKIQAFDALFTNNHIQILKLLLPYQDSVMQRRLAVYIKYMEFRYTCEYFKLHPYCYPPKDPLPDPGEICKEVLPFCSKEESKRLKQLLNMLSSVKNAQEMMDTINSMKDLFPEGFNMGENIDIANILKQMEVFNGTNT